jgi:hypothetical protein
MVNARYRSPRRSLSFSGDDPDGAMEVDNSVIFLYHWLCIVTALKMIVSYRVGEDSKDMEGKVRSHDPSVTRSQTAQSPITTFGVETWQRLMGVLETQKRLATHCSVIGFGPLRLLNTARVIIHDCSEISVLLFRYFTIDVSC